MSYDTLLISAMAERCLAMDEALVDHLDPTSSFEFDIGGQG